MADRFPAQIWIGGRVSNVERLYPDDPDDKTTVLEGLIGALVSDGAARDFGEPVIDDDCAWDSLATYLDNESLLNLKCEAIHNGEFTETEEYCVDNGIAFDRWSDHYCEYDAENVYFRPDMNAPIVTYADSSGHEMVNGEHVRKGLALIEEFKANKSSDLSKLETGLRYLLDACPELPSNLKPFETDLKLVV